MDEVLASLLSREAQPTGSISNRFKDICKDVLDCLHHDHPELVVLRELVEGLPARMVEWVHCHQPVSLEMAMTLTEDHLAAYPEGPGKKQLPPA